MSDVGSMPGKRSTTGSLWQSRSSHPWMAPIRFTGLRPWFPALPSLATQRWIKISSAESHQCQPIQHVLDRWPRCHWTLAPGEPTGDRRGPARIAPDAAPRAEARPPPGVGSRRHRSPRGRRHLAARHLVSPRSIGDSGDIWPPTRQFVQGACWRRLPRRQCACCCSSMSRFSTACEKRWART